MKKETPLAAIKRLTEELRQAEAECQALEAVCREQEAQLKQVTGVTERLRQAEEKARIWESLCRERDALFRSAEKLVLLLAGERNTWQGKAEALQARLEQSEVALRLMVRSENWVLSGSNRGLAPHSWGRHALGAVRLDELLSWKETPQGRGA